MSKDAIYSVVNSTLKRAAGGLSQTYPEHAKIIEGATTHWLRHTFGTRLAKDNPIEVVRDQMRHSSIETTSIYVHSEVDQRFRAVVDF